jgi:DNA-binding XRE family transcriptional regulator
MEREILEIFLKNCGSIEKASKEVGISRETLSAIRNDRNKMQFEHAALIADYMNRHTHIQVDFLDLLPPCKKNKLKHIEFNFNESPFKLSKLFLSDVKHPTKVGYVPEEFSDLEKSRLIIIDENNQLIANPLTYFLHIQNCVQIIYAWRISLLDLIQGKYEISHLTNTFDVIERGYIGISLEKFIGNRKGQRTDLNKPVENSPQVCLLRGIKTRELISQLLDLGSDYTYRQIKKIILHESDTLTEEVRNKKISIFYAASIIRD